MLIRYRRSMAARSLSTLVPVVVLHAAVVIGECTMLLIAHRLFNIEFFAAMAQRCRCFRIAEIDEQEASKGIDIVEHYVRCE